MPVPSSTPRFFHLPATAMTTKPHKMEFASHVHIVPSPGVVLNLSRRGATEDELKCRQLQSALQPKKIRVLSNTEGYLFIGVMFVVALVSDVGYRLVKWMKRRKKVGKYPYLKTNSSVSMVVVIIPKCLS